MNTSEETKSRLRESFWNHLAESPVVMVATPGDRDLPLPMSAQFDEDEPKDLFFFTDTSNRLWQAVDAGHASTCAQYVSRGHEFLASLRGSLQHVADSNVVDRFWSDAVATWYERGRTDPTMRLLRFEVASLELWQVDLTLKGRFKALLGLGVAQEDVQGEHARIRN